MSIPFFILGMQRSGTTHTANYIVENYNYLYLHEPANPTYGLTTNSRNQFITSLKTKGNNTDIRLDWKKGRLYFSKQKYLEKLIELFDKKKFYKCPFLLFYCDEINTPSIFLYRSFEEFALSNLKRGFNFRAFIRNEMTSNERLIELLNYKSDTSVIAGVYTYLANKALSSTNITPIKFDDTVSINIDTWFIQQKITKNHESGVIWKILKSINTWGRGMMKASPKFSEKRRTSNYKEANSKFFCTENISRIERTVITEAYNAQLALEALSKNRLNN